MATLDVLGEDVTRLEETEETVLEYCRALDALAARRLDSNVSVKLTALGLKIDPVECRRQFARILDAAERHGTFVRIDMEDSSVTEETIRIFLEARGRTEKVGLVLQAYLHRSVADAARAAAVSANVRVCKGIYVEPPEIAYQGREEIRDSYSAMVDRPPGGGLLHRDRHARRSPGRPRARDDLEAEASPRGLRIPDAPRRHARPAAPPRRRRPPPARLRSLRAVVVRLLDAAPQGEPGHRGAHR